MSFMKYRMALVAFWVTILLGAGHLGGISGQQECSESAVVVLPQERCVPGKVYKNSMLKGGLRRKNFVFLAQTTSIKQCVEMVCVKIASGFAFLLNGTFCYSVTCLEQCEVDMTTTSADVKTMMVELTRKVFFTNETKCVKSSHQSIAKPQESGEFRILRDVIRKSSNVDVRPAIVDSDVINMTISIRLAQILDVDEIGQTITMNVWTTQTWSNPLLMWNPLMYDNVTVVNVEPDMVWTPRIVLHNNAGEQPSGIEKQRTKVIIENTGTNLWYATTLIKSQCKINTRYFPFDEQICYLRLSSWTLPYHKFDLSYADDVESMTHYINNSEWEVLSFKTKKSIVLYPCCPEPFAEVVYRLHIERKTLYYIYTMIVPCTIITALVAMGFFLPPSSGERITLNVTILVAITVYLNIASKKLPTTSENIPLLSTFYFLMVIQVAISIMATTLVLRFHFRGSLLGKMPHWIRYVVIERLGKVLCGTEYKYVIEQETESSVREEAYDTEVTHGNNGNGVTVTRRAPSSGMRRPSRSMETIPLATATGRTRGYYAEESDDERCLTTGRMDYQMRCMSMYQMQRDNRRRVAEDIATIVEAEKTKTTKRSQLDEWQLASMVVDRLFFILSLFAVVACTVIIMLRPKHIAADVQL